MALIILGLGSARAAVQVILPLVVQRTIISWLKVGNERNPECYDLNDETKIKVRIRPR
jgi:hypothetical protein